MGQMVLLWFLFCLLLILKVIKYIQNYKNIKTLKNKNKWINQVRVRECVDGGWRIESYDGEIWRYQGQKPNAETAWDYVNQMKKERESFYKTLG